MAVYPRVPTLHQKECHRSDVQTQVKTTQVNHVLLFVLSPSSVFDVKKKNNNKRKKMMKKNFETTFNQFKKQNTKKQMNKSIEKSRSVHFVHVFFFCSSIISHTHTSLSVLKQTLQQWFNEDVITLGDLYKHKTMNKNETEKKRETLNMNSDSWRTRHDDCFCNPTAHKRQRAHSES